MHNTRLDEFQNECICRDATVKGGYPEFGVTSGGLCREEEDTSHYLALIYGLSCESDRDCNFMAYCKFNWVISNRWNPFSGEFELLRQGHCFPQNTVFIVIGTICAGFVIVCTLPLCCWIYRRKLKPRKKKSSRKNADNVSTDDSIYPPSTASEAETTQLSAISDSTVPASEAETVESEIADSSV